MKETKLQIFYKLQKYRETKVIYYVKLCAKYIPYCFILTWWTISNTEVKKHDAKLYKL